MKSTLAFLATLAVGAMLVFATAAIPKPDQDLHPIAYTETTNYLRYERVVDLVRSTVDTNQIIGWRTQSTNWPTAVIHAVTYGRGTNAVFILKTQELLLPTPEADGWRGSEWKFYEAATWVEGVK